MTKRTRGLKRRLFTHETSLTHQQARECQKNLPSERKRLGHRGAESGDEDEEEKEGDIRSEDHDHDDADDSGSRHSYDGIKIAIGHVNLYDWIHKWTKEYGIPGITLVGVFNTLCLDGRSVVGRHCLHLRSILP